MPSIFWFPRCAWESIWDMQFLPHSMGTGKSMGVRFMKADAELKVHTRMDKRLWRASTGFLVDATN